MEHVTLLCLGTRRMPSSQYWGISWGHFAVEQWLLQLQNGTSDSQAQRMSVHAAGAWLVPMRMGIKTCAA